jgi:hypothetical protein
MTEPEPTSSPEPGWLDTADADHAAARFAGEVWADASMRLEANRSRAYLTGATTILAATTSRRPWMWAPALAAAAWACRPVSIWGPGPSVVAEMVDHRDDRGATEALALGSYAGTDDTHPKSSVAIIHAAADRQCDDTRRAAAILAACAVAHAAASLLRPARTQP